MTLKTFEGQPSLAVRSWAADERGRSWPVKGQGVSVRLGEVAGAIDALRGTIAAAGERARPAATAPSRLPERRAGR